MAVGTLTIAIPKLLWVDLTRLALPAASDVGFARPRPGFAC